jgi:peptidyl-prolyl cis-trans isomerase C
MAASGAFAATPVVRVNGDDITDVDVKLAQRAIASQMQGVQANETAVLRETVEQLIGRTLILQAAREAKVAIDPKEVAASIEHQRTQMGGAEAFSKALAQAGLTEQDLTRMEHDRMMVQKYVQSELLSKAGAGEQEVRAYYDAHPDEFKHEQQVKLRMIVTQVPQGADQAQQDAAKARAETARSRVLAGEDFAKVASEVSDHPNKANGGALGNWVREAALPEFESMIKGVKVGGVTEVLKNPHGFFVFKVEDRRAPGLTSFDEAKDSLTTFLRNRKLDDSIRLVIATRRQKAKVETLDPAIKAAMEAPAAVQKPAAGATMQAPAAPATASAKPSPDAPKKP